MTGKQIRHWRGGGFLFHECPSIPFHSTSVSAFSSAELPLSLSSCFICSDRVEFSQLFLLFLRNHGMVVMGKNVLNPLWLIKIFLEKIQPNSRMDRIIKMGASSGSIEIERFFFPAFMTQKNCTFA